MASRRQRFKPPDIIDFKWRDRQTEETICDMFADSIERIRLEDAASLPPPSSIAETGLRITVEPVAHSTVEPPRGGTVVLTPDTIVAGDERRLGKPALSSTVIRNQETTVVGRLHTTAGNEPQFNAEAKADTTVVRTPGTTVVRATHQVNKAAVKSHSTTVEQSPSSTGELRSKTTVVPGPSTTVNLGPDTAPLPEQSPSAESGVVMGGENPSALRSSTVELRHSSTVELASSTEPTVASNAVAELASRPAGVAMGRTPTTDAARSGPSRAEPHPTTTVVPEDDSTVEVEDLLPMPASMIWVTESGDFVPPSRVRQLRNNKVQLALNPQELKMFQYLWGFPRDWGGEEYRETQVGYTQLIRELELSKRSVRLILHRLIEKCFIGLQSPSTYERQAAVYRVYCYQSVFKALERAGKLYYAHSGQGTVFVKPYSSGLRPVDPPASSITVDLAPNTTVDLGLSTTVQSGIDSTVESERGITVEERASSTVAFGHGSTVELRAPLRESLGESDQERSSSSAELVEALVTAVVSTLTIDDGLARIALSKLRQPLKIHQAVYFARLAATKVATQKNALNPQGLWVVQFANYASGTTMKLYEEQVRLEREQYRSLGMTEATWKAVLTNPDVAADQKDLARRILDI